jgi:hypothetical protein
LFTFNTDPTAIGLEGFPEGFIEFSGRGANKVSGIDINSPNLSKRFGFFIGRFVYFILASTVIILVALSALGLSLHSRI